MIFTNIKMRLYKILYWLTLLGGLFIIALGFLMDYFDTNTASFVTSRTSYGNSILTPFGIKLIGCIILVMWIGHIVNKNELIKERKYLDSVIYISKDIKKQEKRNGKKEKILKFHLLIFRYCYKIYNLNLPIIHSFHNTIRKSYFWNINLTCSAPFHCI